MKAKKRIWAVLLACAMVISGLPATVYATDAAECTHENTHKGTPVREATCQKTGIGTIVCDDCGKVSYETLPKSHKAPEDETAVTVVEPTCVDAGSRSFTCTVCGETVTTVTEATGEHTYEYDIVDATCTENAKVGSVCSVCGEDDPDNPPDEVPESMLGHHYVADAEHSKAATCTEDGISAEKCTNCGDVKTTTIAGGHVEPTAEGSVVIEYTDGDCTQGGTKTFTCTKCNTEVTEEVSAEAAHNYVSDVVEEETCTTDAKMGSVCSRCGKVDESEEPEEVPGSALGHDMEVDEEASTDATCTVDGTLVKKCTREGCDYTETETIEATGHTPGTDPDDMEDLPADCVNNARTVIKCADCDEYAVTIDMVTDLGSTAASDQKLGHDWGEFEADEENEGQHVRACKRTGCDATDSEACDYEEETIAATCQSPESTKKTCKVCGDVVVEEGEGDADPDAHVYEEVEVRGATCTKTGIAQLKCACGATNGYVVIPAGHTYEEEDIEVMAEPTCTEDGTGTVTCESCGQEVEVTIEALGHDFEMKVTKQATCTEAGSQIKTCKRQGCGATEGEAAAIEKLAHTYVEGYIVEATCTENEKVGEACSVCGTLKEGTEWGEVPNSATGHDMQVDDEASEEPTCTAAGKEVKKCANEGCNETEETVIPATGHTPSTDPDDMEDLPADCVNNARTVIKCANCDENAVEIDMVKDLGSEEESDKALGHDWSEFEPDEANEGKHVHACQRTGCDATESANCDYEEETIEATCQSPESTKKTCKVCGDVVVEEGDGDVDGNAHVYEEVTVRAATCTKTGIAQKKCACGATNGYVVIPAGHTYEEEDIEVTTEPTCTEDGAGTVTCESCGQEVKVTIDALGHDLEMKVTKLATCTEAGSQIKTCKRQGCGATEGEAETIEKLAHTYEESHIVEATCTENEKVGKACTVCGEPAEGVTLTEMENTALGHDWADDEENSEEATCTKAGVKAEKCSRCNETKRTTLPATGHTPSTDPDDMKDLPADCVNNARAVIKCANCDENAVEIDMVEDLGSEEESDQALGHDWSDFEPDEENEGKHVHACQHTGCDATESANCDYEEETIAATCQSPESTKKTCKVCKDVVIEESEGDVNENAHVYGKVVVRAATCTKTGIAQLKCACGKTNGYEVIPAGHTYEEEDIEVTAEPTCTEDGTGTVTCESCGQEVEVTIEAIGHDLEMKVTKQATCTEAGSQIKTCKRQGCGATEGEAETIEKLAHTYEESHIVEATCTENEKVGKACTVCGEPADGVTLTEMENTALGHDWEVDEEASTAATCTEAGEKVEKCSRCEKTQETPIDATGHTPGTDVEELPADCENNARTVVKCAVCGEISSTIDEYQLSVDSGNEDVSLKALGHQFGDWTSDENGKHYRTCGRTGCNEKEEENCTYGEAVTTAATCNTYATSTKTCTVCAYELTETTGNTYDSSKHNYVETVIRPATCAKSGIGQKLCACGASDGYYVISAGAHNWGEQVTTKAATCKEAGTATKTCSICSTTETIELEMLEHTWGDDYVNDEGTAMLRKCSACGEVEVVWASEDYEACQHEHKTTVVGKAATCTESGLTDGEKCTDCDEMVTPQTTIPAKGHTVVTDARVEPTETMSGLTEGSHCSVCNAVLVEQEVIPATGSEACKHTNTETIPAVVATCTAAGKTAGTKCSDCGAVIKAQTTTAINPNNHTSVVTDARVEPTETTDGKTEGSHCSACNTVITAQDVIPATGPSACQHANKRNDGGTAATCEDDGFEAGVYCEDCETWISGHGTISALGHDWNAGTINFETGEMTYTCQRCGETKTE